MTGYPSFFVDGVAYRYVVRALVVDKKDESRHMATGVEDRNPQRWNPWRCTNSRPACSGIVAVQ
jgi:hypothetical protein